MTVYSTPLSLLANKLSVVTIAKPAALMILPGRMKKYDRDHISPLILPWELIARRLTCPLRWGSMEFFSRWAGYILKIARPLRELKFTWCCRHDSRAAG